MSLLLKEREGSRGDKLYLHPMENPQLEENARCVVYDVTSTDQRPVTSAIYNLYRYSSSDDLLMTALPLIIHYL
jgi:hypothetical protein